MPASLPPICLAGNRFAALAAAGYLGRMSLPFLKMHGAGNDFVVLDARAEPIQLSVDAVRHIADRRRGGGV